MKKVDILSEFVVCYYYYYFIFLARKIAEKEIAIQIEAFKRWGIMADFE